MLWGRSAIRFVDKVKTPIMLSHGDADLLVNPAEDEHSFIALRDVGVEAIMLRYPREGHGMRETQHIADFLYRTIDRKSGVKGMRVSVRVDLGGRRMFQNKTTHH